MRELRAGHARSVAVLMLVTVLPAACQSKQEQMQAAIKGQEQRVSAELGASGFSVKGGVSCPNFHLLKDQVGDWIRCGVDLQGEDPQLYEIAVKRVTGNGHNLWHVKRATMGVGKEKLQAEAERWLGDHPQPRKVKSVTCEEHLIGVTGDSVRCSIKFADGTSAGLTSTLEGIEGGMFASLSAGGVATSTAVRYRQEIDADPELVSALVLQRLRERGGGDVAGMRDAVVQCKEFLQARIGATTRCLLLKPGKAAQAVTVSYRAYDRRGNDAGLDVELRPIAERG